jgi:hypothetical protein
LSFSVLRLFRRCRRIRFRRPDLKLFYWLREPIPFWEMGDDQDDKTTQGKKSENKTIQDGKYLQ